ncbi:MAG: hypothetical protein P8179_20020 [Candidatus Thiodiazotropha sp.]|jgi:hypothetical protein
MVESAALLVDEVIPEQQELIELVHTISQWVAGFLERKGILERDEDDCMDAGGRAKQEPGRKQLPESG